LAKCKHTIQGSKFKVTHCKGAYTTFEESLKSLTLKKADSLKRQMGLQIQRLADGLQMSKEHFPQEGLLPGRPGKTAKHFYAFKRLPVRAYCWLSETYPQTYFISHYIYKDYTKLASSETKRVCDNWQRIEENGDER